MLTSAGFSWRTLVVLPALLPCLLCCLWGSWPGQTPPLVRTRPLPRPLQFATYSVNHGSEPVEAGVQLTSHFRFRNVGTESVRIGTIERSCGCLTPELAPRVVAPGEYGLLSVSVPMMEQGPGFHEYQLTVNYEDSEPHAETLLVKAVFPEAKVQLMPQSVIMSQASERPLTHSFQIADHRAAPLRVGGVESTVPWVQPAVASVQDQGRVTQVSLEVAGGIPEGNHRVLVHAETSDPSVPAVVFPMLVQGPRRLQPVQMRPSVLRLHAQQTEESQVLFRVPADWDVSHVECFPPELQVTGQENQADGDYQRITLSLRLTGPPASRTREGVVTLHADQSRHMATLRTEIVGQ